MLRQIAGKFFAFPIGLRRSLLLVLFGVALVVSLAQQPAGTVGKSRRACISAKAIVTVASLQTRVGSSSAIKSRFGDNINSMVSPVESTAR